MVTRLPVDEAARVLGISQPTIKRRLKSGALRGVQERTPSGFRWLVILETPATPPDVAAGIPANTPGATAPGVAAEIPPATPQMPNLAQRAEEMARYTAALLEPLHAQLKEQAEEIGTLRERCATLQARLAAATNGHRHEDAPLAEWPTERRWYQRLVWG